MLNSRLIIGVIFSALLLNGAFANAETARGGKWEGTLQLIGNSSESSNGDFGSSLDVKSNIGIAGGLAYNLNSHFAIGFDASFIKPKYTAVFATEEDGLVTVKHRMSVFSGQFNGVWNILDGPFTPYLQASIGWTYIDSNVSDGPPSTGCWWDPWWGYVCRSFFSTYDETSLSYGAGAGLRYEFDNRTFVKGSYNYQKVDVSGGADPSFDLWRLEIGWMF